MVDRFEFEVDTTKANEFWQDEVAQNLRKKAEDEAAAENAENPQIMTGT
jgi:3-ketosteroid 9alpha-monooxygenase subunit A